MFNLALYTQDSRTDESETHKLFTNFQPKSNTL